MPRIDLRKYMRKRSFNKREWCSLKREYIRLEKKINLFRHKQSKIDVKLQCYTPSHQQTP